MALFWLCTHRARQPNRLTGSPGFPGNPGRPGGPCNITTISALLCYSKIMNNTSCMVTVLRVATNPHSFQSRSSRFTHISLREIHEQLNEKPDICCYQHVHHLLSHWPSCPLVPEALLVPASLGIPYFLEVQDIHVHPAKYSNKFIRKDEHNVPSKDSLPSYTVFIYILLFYFIYTLAF